MKVYLIYILTPNPFFIDNGVEVTTTIIEVTACESYEWNGETYTESGSYEYSEQNNNEFSMSFDGVDDYVDVNNINAVGPTLSLIFLFVMDKS